ncbi:MAG: hypothetical protein L0Y72_11640 [Gemmataceae bacterium]|nr:hypothetical protein [Gemmataceae bacterium]
MKAPASFEDAVVFGFRIGKGTPNDQDKARRRRGNWSGVSEHFFNRDPQSGWLRTSEPRALVEHFFRHEFGRLAFVLTRSLGVRRLALPTQEPRPARD